MKSIAVGQGEWASCEPPPLEGADKPGVHQGGDSRWSGNAKLDLDRLMTAPPVSLAERGTAPTDRPSGISGHVLGEVPRYGICAGSLLGAECRSEASQIQRGHCEDNVGVHEEAFNSPTPLGKVAAG